MTIISLHLNEEIETLLKTQLETNGKGRQQHIQDLIKAYDPYYNSHNTNYNEPIESLDVASNNNNNNNDKSIFKYFAYLVQDIDTNDIIFTVERIRENNQRLTVYNNANLPSNKYTRFGTLEETRQEIINKCGGIDNVTIIDYYVTNSSLKTWDITYKGQ